MKHLGYRGQDDSALALSVLVRVKIHIQYASVSSVSSVVNVE